MNRIVYFQDTTTNQSFMDMHYFLKAKGIKNNKFFFEKNLIMSRKNFFFSRKRLLMSRKNFVECHLDGLICFL